jgi:hypothetical protein
MIAAYTIFDLTRMRELCCKRPWFDVTPEPGARLVEYGKPELPSRRLLYEPGRIRFAVMSHTGSRTSLQKSSRNLRVSNAQGAHPGPRTVTVLDHSAFDVFIDAFGRLLAEGGHLTGIIGDAATVTSDAEGSEG